MTYFVFARIGQLIAHAGAWRQGQRTSGAEALWNKAQLGSALAAGQGRGLDDSLSDWTSLTSNILLWGRGGRGKGKFRCRVTLGGAQAGSALAAVRGRGHAGRSLKELQFLSNSI